MKNVWNQKNTGKMTGFYLHRNDCGRSSSYSHTVTGPGTASGDCNQLQHWSISSHPGYEGIQNSRIIQLNDWKVEILPEHHDICFNFIRHLFDLFVVGFLWTVSPPAKLILEVLGVQGALRLWLHGMAMFFVSTVGMAGLLWLIQEYLPQFALIYGIIQAVVISVSVRQSVIIGLDEDKEEKDELEKETDDMTDVRKHKEDKVKTS
ncbi:DUF4661 domain containing protein [Scophthalmus maximus]|uniref:DUF4661 domain containing protein n=1 Tax=Scophthalmus maximus TaxID=52904 RepID=A0A2U9BMU7_SCOMX|nr:DUF4661 domain containing protein [Scophthalmus maximus]